MTFRANERVVLIPIFGVLEAYSVEVKESSASFCGRGAEAGELEAK